MTIDRTPASPNDAMTSLNVLGRRKRRTRLVRFAAPLVLVATLGSAILPVAPAQADVAREMDDFMRDAGAAASVTGPSAFQGQSAGYYNRADPSKWDAVNTAVPRNYTWHVLKASKFFNEGGSFDRELAEYVMTLVGTIIYVPPTDSDPGKFQPLSGDTSSTLVTALLDGATAGSVQIYRCDDEEKCLNPSLAPLSVPVAKAIRPRVTALIDGMVDAIRTDTAITPAQKELLQIASVPLYKILTVQAAYSRGLATDDRATLAEIASIDLLYAILDQLMSEVGKTKASFIAADEGKLAAWTAQITAARNGLADRQQTTQARVTAIMAIIEKTQFLENVLASSMSPGMAASLDWSRGVATRGLN